ncbi:MAG: CPBP family glutamic-type intramembrane protease [Candidatus Krumholzibacteria bacterium]|nr:CPBP family glutamic-type intramembrane protease [Candidatus Krumholzibacteria bacterium]
MGLLLPLIPYVAMLIGLHLLGSAWISFLIYHGLVLVAVWRETGLRRDLLRGWHKLVGLGAIGFGVGGGVLIYTLAPYAGINADLINPAIGKLGLAGTGWLLFVIYHTLVNPWFEEILWRGKLGHDGLKPVWGDVLFAGYHVLVLMLFLEWLWILLAFVVLVAAGWFWRQLRRRHEGLLLPVISHLAADGSIMAVVYMLSLKN